MLLSCSKPPTLDHHNITPSPTPPFSQLYSFALKYVVEHQTFAISFISDGCKKKNVNIEHNFNRFHQYVCCIGMNINQKSIAAFLVALQLPFDSLYVYATCEIECKTGINMI